MFRLLFTLTLLRLLVSMPVIGFKTGRLVYGSSMRGGAKYVVNTTRSIQGGASYVVNSSKSMQGGASFT